MVEFFSDRVQIVATLLSGDQSPVCSSVRGWQLRCQSQDKLINKYFNTSTRYFWTGRYSDIHCWQNWSKVVIVMLSSIKDSLKMFSSGLWKGSLQKKLILIKFHENMGVLTFSPQKKFVWKDLNLLLYHTLLCPKAAAPLLPQMSHFKASLKRHWGWSISSIIFYMKIYNNNNWLSIDHTVSLRD